MRCGDRTRHTGAMPDWLRTTLPIAGVLALLVVLVIGYVSGATTSHRVAWSR